MTYGYAMLHAKDDGIWPVVQTEYILRSEVDSEAVEGLITQRYLLSVVSTRKCSVDAESGKLGAELL